MKWKVHYCLWILSVVWYAPQAQNVVTVAGVLETPGFNDGPALSARFFNPHGIAVDSVGNVFIADRFNHTIRKVTIDGQVITIAGKAGVQGDTDGPGDVARFNEPWGLCVDKYGNVFVADTRNNKIRKITPQGVVSTIAGSGNFGSSDGVGVTASFGNPTGIEVDEQGNLYVADHLTHIIRKITPQGQVTTLAGFPYIPGSADGQGSGAQFWRPYGLTLDNDGNILVADEWNHKIRKVTPQGVVTTIAGTGDVGHVNGPGLSAAFNYPWDVSVDDQGNIYVGDGYNYVVRKITPQGVVSTIAGVPLETGGTDGPALEATFSGVTGIAWCPGTGELFLADAYNHLVRKLIFDDQFLNLINLTGSEVCAGNPIQLQATPEYYDFYRFFVNGNIVQESSSPILQTSDWSPGTYQVFVEAGNNGNLLTSNTLTITVLPEATPSITIVGTLSFYEGDSVTLVASGVAGTFVWNTGDTTQTLTVYTAGTYYVQLFADNYCPGISESITVEVLPTPGIPTISIAGDTLLCAGQTVQLTSSFTQNVQWYRDGWPIDGATSPTIVVSQTGAYQVQAQDLNSGTLAFSDPINVVVLPAPNFTFSVLPTTTIQLGDTLWFIAEGPSEYYYEWHFGDGTFSTGMEAIHVYSQVGTYSLTLWVETPEGCRDTISYDNYIQITATNNTVPPPPPPSTTDTTALFIPTAFTPNGDGLNDVFRPRGALSGKFRMYIFNQWGQQLHFTQDPIRGWDGTSNGLPVHNGTYVYLIYIEPDGAPRQAWSGHITLIR